MKIGKEIKEVKSPARRATKVHKEKPIPVKIPEKQPQKVEAFEFNWRIYYGMDLATKKDLSIIHVSGS